MQIKILSALALAGGLVLAPDGTALAIAASPGTGHDDMSGMAMAAADTPAMTISAAAADPLAPVSVGDIEISSAFARATLPNAPVAGGFFTVTNKGQGDDRLVSASSPMAGKVQLHEMSMQGDVMKMAELPDGIPLPAGTTVSLTPSGLHMMFMQLKGPFVEGQTVPVTLTFEKAGSVTVQLPVAGIGADSPAM